MVKRSELVFQADLGDPEDGVVVGDDQPLQVDVTGPHREDPEHRLDSMTQILEKK